MGQRAIDSGKRLYDLPKRAVHPSQQGDVRAPRLLAGFLRAFEREWPYWAFFFNQVDDSIKILMSCACGAAFPGDGAVEIDADKLGDFLLRGFAGINALFEKHGFPENELKIMSQGVVQVVEQA